MRCPNCGAKIQKTSNICLGCGTKLTQIENASNKDITKARKEYQPEKVVYSSVFPKDLSYKKTLLLAIFLGVFGAHRYYTKQYISAIIMSVTATVFTLFFGILGMIFGNVGIQGFIIVSSNTLNAFSSIISLLGAINIIAWAFDIIKLATKTYKVPVVLAE